MAINKKLIHFNKKTTFNSQKLSANDSNTQYQVGGTGTVQTGAPDINYQSIVYIKDSKEIWTHGQFYATAVTWSTITGKPSFATVATSGSYNDLNNKPTIPTSLPTPNSLTFTGATTGTWNGSAAKTVNIPTYSNASTSSAGLMSSSDKTKLNSLSSNIIKSRNSYVECNMSTDKISIYAPSATVEAQGTSIDIHDNDKTTSFGMNGMGEIVMNADGTITLTANNDVFLTSGECMIQVGPTGTQITGGQDLYIDMNPRFLGGTVQIGESGTSVGLRVYGDVNIDGQVQASGGFFDTSDARVKTNVKELDASKADKVRLVEFDRTDVEHHGYGIIAQELEEVYPEMVHTDDKGFKSVNYDELAMVKIKYLEDKVARLEALVGRLLAE